jgi:hypothetical protein
MLVLYMVLVSFSRKGCFIDLYYYMIFLPNFSVTLVSDHHVIRISGIKIHLFNYI